MYDRGPRRAKIHLGQTRESRAVWRCIFMETGSGWEKAVWYTERAGGGCMSRLALAILAIGLFLSASPASAYVWRCHTPSGNVWTSQPPASGDCEEYDGVF